ncbi:hypothetical protein LTR97_011974 [Elasticomyces elasticus]|uniref:SET domain-containing protein n=1 Tax=Elasticomyces elasticus TaxID=574655 RepID=A0AAN7W0Y1_9PEZI|nr:hypothetical protein LTR97_011974 [Elasticomyces elasticus]
MPPINEYWNSATALFITLRNSKPYTYPEVKAIDVAWDLLVGRGGQLAAAAAAFVVIWKSLLLSIEKQPVPLPLAYSVYFDWISLSLGAAILRNLAIPFYARDHHEKAVPFHRLLGWLYLCIYVLVLPTIISAMTGYQTTGDIWFAPPMGSTRLAPATEMVPNPALTIRDGSRVGLADNEAVDFMTRAVVLYGEVQVNEYYNTILSYYFAMQNALHNTTWTLNVQSVSSLNLRAIGPTYSGNTSAWAYCTVSHYGDYCADDDTGHIGAPTPADPPLYGTPDSIWSNITLNNQTYVLQPPPLDIIWAAPATTWAVLLGEDPQYGGYFPNASVAETAVCLPSTKYQWGFSAVLLCLFCCMTILFAATLLALEIEIWLDSRSNLYQQRRSGYRDAVNVVHALQEELGEEVVTDYSEAIEPRIKSYTGSMRVDTEGLGLSRRQTGMSGRQSRSQRGQEVFPDIPLLEHAKSDVFASSEFVSDNLYDCCSLAPGATDPAYDRLQHLEPEIMTAAITNCYELRDAGSKGVGLFATRHIPAGTLILSELPIVTFDKHLDSVSSEEISAAVDRLSIADKQRWAELRTVVDIPNHVYHPNDKYTKDELKFLLNNYNDHSSCGIWNLCCRLNFSCQPNTRIMGNPDRLEIFATADIKQNDEMTNTHFNHAAYFMTTAERRKYITKGFAWNCECNLCKAPAVERNLSDMRRRLAAHIMVFLGEDASQKVKLEQFDLTRRTVGEAMRAQTSHLGPTSRATVCWVLLAASLDADGIVMEGFVSKAYAEAARTLIERALGSGLDELPAPALVLYRSWWKRFSELATLLPGDSERGLPVELRWKFEEVSMDGKFAGLFP